MVICLQIPLVFWIGGRITFASYYMYVELMSGRPKIHTAEPLVPVPSSSEVKIAIE
jgi:hypothetical protein